MVLCCLLGGFLNQGNLLANSFRFKTAFFFAKKNAPLPGIRQRGVGKEDDREVYVYHGA